MLALGKELRTTNGPQIYKPPFSVLKITDWIARAGPVWDQGRIDNLFFVVRVFLLCHLFAQHAMNATAVDG